MGTRRLVCLYYLCVSHTHIHTHTHTLRDMPQKPRKDIQLHLKHTLHMLPQSAFADCRIRIRILILIPSIHIHIRIRSWMCNCNSIHVSRGRWVRCRIRLRPACISCRCRCCCCCHCCCRCSISSAFHLQFPSVLCDCCAPTQCQTLKGMG